MIRRGFTLVELSIVLVIIGLLIGGILVARSMIGTARVQSVVRQLAQYDIAISNFKNKFNQLPGDSNLFTAPNGWVGNNDSIINDNIQEAWIAWWQLSQGVGLKNAQMTDYVAYVCCPPPTPPSEANFPRFKIDQDMTNPPFLFIGSWDHYGSAPMRPGYLYAEWPNANPDEIDYAHASPLGGNDALAMDTKIDDAAANTGNIWAVYDGPGLCYDLSTGKYNQTGNYVCRLYISNISGEIIK